jgi:mono/diheme cytochrome c family protein
MKNGTLAALAIAAILPAAANSYPGGTPNYQTNVAPYCSSCHSSRDAAALVGAGERAAKEVAERKHIALILEGRGKGYAALTENDRKTLAAQIRALDAASTVKLDAPATVQRGQTFQVTVAVTGGGGPVVGVELVDLDHRWYARPATAVGWEVVMPPQIVGADGQPANSWLEKRPEVAGRNLTYVNIPGVSSNPVTEEWGSARVTFTLRAPDRSGSLPLAAAYLYGTEKSTVLGYTTNAVGWKEVRGGTAGGSGRVLFTPVVTIRVE